MKNLIESNAVVLTAGKQTRYGQRESKMMACIDQRPAFYYTMGSILNVFPEELVTIVSSTLFQDFNDYISHNYQKAKLVFDKYPGNGSAQSLRSSFPWQSENVFVTEGNIFYEDYLICQMFEKMDDDKNLMGVLSITSKVEVAKTHRKVILEKGLNLTGQKNDANTFFRNIGAYVLANSIQENVGQTPDIIEVLNLLNLAGASIFVLEYRGIYLHMETPNDIPLWREELKDWNKLTLAEPK